ncbi:MAG: hypothetical protein WC307_05125 [Candidatus Nanoarchaeia archaeon]|jgi:hypothetical protein
MSDVPLPLIEILDKVINENNKMAKETGHITFSDRAMIVKAIKRDVVDALRKFQDDLKLIIKVKEVELKDKYNRIFDNLYKSGEISAFKECLQEIDEVFGVLDSQESSKKPNRLVDKDTDREVSNSGSNPDSCNRCENFKKIGIYEMWELTKPHGTEYSRGYNDAIMDFNRLLTKYNLDRYKFPAKPSSNLSVCNCLSDESLKKLNSFKCKICGKFPIQCKCKESNKK